MAITPNSVIKLFSGIPLDNKYENTINFGSKSAQTNYFVSNAKFTLQPNTYQRVNKGTMRIAKRADDCYDCNYLAFQNTNYGTKWFYAFILSVEYVNDSTCEITYELDYMQTYFFDITLKQCYVEREHIVTDEFGANLEPEPVLTDLVYNYIQIGDYPNQYNVPQALDTDPVYYLLAVCSADIDGPSATDYYINGQAFIGYLFHSTSLSDVLEKQQEYVTNGTTDRIIGIFKSNSDFTKFSSRSGSIPSESISFNNLGGVPQSYGDFTPNNKKSLQYPYQCFEITNKNGVSNDIQYELYTDTNSSTSAFVAKYDVGLDDSIMIFPANYKHLGYSFDEAIYSSARIEIPVYRTSFDGENAVRILANTLASSVIKVPTLSQAEQSVSSTGTLLGGIADDISSTATNFGRSYAQVQIDKYLSHAISKPVANSGKMLVKMHEAPFAIRKKQLYPSLAKIYDNFFDKYGYATNMVKVPNIDSRSHWNYVKTRDCIVVGNSAPTEAISIIASIFNSGITFWKSPSYVGDYTLPNT